MQVVTLITAKFLMLVTKVRRTSGRESISDHEARIVIAVSQVRLCRNYDENIPNTRLLLLVNTSLSLKKVSKESSSKLMFQ